MPKLQQKLTNEAFACVTEHPEKAHWHLYWNWWNIFPSSSYLSCSRELFFLLCALRVSLKEREIFNFLKGFPHRKASDGDECIFNIISAFTYSKFLFCLIGKKIWELRAAFPSSRNWNSINLIALATLFFILLRRSSLISLLAVVRWQDLDSLIFKEAYSGKQNWKWNYERETLENCFLLILICAFSRRCRGMEDVEL